MNTDENSKTKQKNAISALRFFAWLNLISGIIGGIILWVTMGTKEVPYYLISGTHTEINPIGVSLGFASIIVGMIGCAFFLVICSMAENLIQIRETLQDKNDKKLIEN
jgi:membrane associated rhomboid family serine protease